MPIAPTPYIISHKTMPFKGGTQNWSNRYHFSGGTPASSADWHALMDAIVAAEAAALWGGITIVECVGYLAGSTVGTESKSYSTPGSVAASSGARHCPGEVAAVIRYTTTQRTSKNHPIYLFNYYHAPFVQSGNPSDDTLDPNQQTALETLGTDFVNGFISGTYKKAGPNGAVAQARSVLTYVTHRDFPK